jgi:hypothetical protein
MRWPGVLGMAACATLAGCSQKAEVNYRITVEVDDNGVTHTGSGVWNVKMEAGMFPNTYVSTFRGEAFPVELGTKGTMFVLIAERNDKGHVLSGGGMATYGRHLFGDVARYARGEAQTHLNPLEETREFAAQLGKTATLDCANLPKTSTFCPFMVRFRDVRDPLTVEAVDPINLAASFGPGVRLLPLKVTITEDEVTVGLATRLTWLGEFPESRLDPNYKGSDKPNLSQQLSFGEFRKGTEK